MIWRRGFNLWHIILVVVNGLLLLAIAHIWWGENGPPTAIRPAKGPEMPKAPMLRDRQPMTAFRVVAAKDLFNSERRGPEADKPAVKVEVSLEGRQLMGTMIIGSERIALISAKAGAVKGRSEAQIDVVHQGEEYEGFKIVEISSEEVVLQGKEGKKTINFPE